MIITVENVLENNHFNGLINYLETAHFIDGKLTAGWHAKLVKNNTQLPASDQQIQDFRSTIIKALKNNTLFQMVVQPKVIHSLLFSRYDQGMFYGQHTDNAIMGGDDFIRADVSFTLFLSDPNCYEGGELVIEYGGQQQSYKLPQNSLIAYPSSTLHQVQPVTKGSRLVVVGWVRSLIRSTEQRELLFDLDTVRRSIFKQYGKTPEFDLLSKTYSNLLRLWVD